MISVNFPIDAYEHRAHLPTRFNELSPILERMNEIDAMQRVEAEPPTISKRDTRRK